MESPGKAEAEYSYLTTLLKWGLLVYLNTKALGSYQTFLLHMGIRRQVQISACWGMQAEKAGRHPETKLHGRKGLESKETVTRHATFPSDPTYYCGVEFVWENVHLI